LDEAADALLEVGLVVGRGKRPLPEFSPRRAQFRGLGKGAGEYKTPRLAGTYADEFNVYPGPNYAERIKRCKDAAVAAGRDPEAILISSAGQVIAKETQEEFEEHLNEVAIERGMTREELDAYFALRRPPQGTYEQVRKILDEYTEMGMQRFYFQGIYGNPDPRELLDGLGIHG
jgi:alkanesulfonate monooxygenase SsuD/methylene tetrahydromethanopterin reductase-like flavin-dependent oxidoreductase (luciferase family)